MVTVFRIASKMLLGICLLLISFATGSEIILNVLDFGAVGDGAHDDTPFISKALESAKSRMASSMGWATIVFPSGKTFLSGPLNITSFTTLQVEGTVLAISGNNTNGGESYIRDGGWPQIPPLPSYGNSDDGPILQYQSFVYAKDATDVRIVGSGTIDGQGDWWWANQRNRSVVVSGRPNLIQFVNCTNVEITGVTLRDSPFWCLHPVYCTNVHIHHMSIRSRMYAPNSDGIDPDSSKNVMIEYNDVSCGDDHIAIKSGRCGDSSTPLSCQNNNDFISGRYETRNVTVRNNIFRIGMGIAVGSESSGGIHDVYIYDNIVGVCEFGHCDNECCGWGPALHLKTTMSRGNIISNIQFRNNTVYNTSSFILLELDYQTKGGPPSGYTPTTVRNISFVNNKALGGAVGADWHCSAEDACEQINVINNTVRNGQNPWGCKYIRSFNVSGNSPAGLEKCMRKSMNPQTFDKTEESFKEKQ